jgi:hypothetical protein
MTIIDNHTQNWNTVTSSSDTSSIPENQSSAQSHQRVHNQQRQYPQLQVHASRTPTDRLEEFFYEQAKFFRHLERKYERFNHKSREDERYARAGKFKHRPKLDPAQVEQQKQQQQQQAKPTVYGPLTLKQQQASDHRRAQRQAQASGSNQKPSHVQNSQGEILQRGK